MKTRITNTKRVLTFGVALLMTSWLYAENPSGNKAKDDRHDNQNTEISGLLKFTAKYYEGTVYLNWVVRNQSEECIYVVKRSSNGKDFKTIGYKEGVTSARNLDVANYYKDESPFLGTSYYRIVRIGMNLSITHTGVEKITNGLLQEIYYGYINTNN